jgi:hypothetical protein
MADYTGYAITDYDSDPINNHFPVHGMSIGKSRLTTTEFFSGARSLELGAGAWVLIYCVLDGSSVIRVKALPPAGGKVGLKLLSLSGERLASDYNVGASGSVSGSQDWETLEISYNATTAGTYLICLSNLSGSNGAPVGDRRAYFDNLEVETA